jgi:hypothetical protein
MSKRTPLVLCVLVLAGMLPLAAQQAAPPDYLTEEEVQKVRDTQEPDKRVLLFLEFAALRLAKFEQALASKPPVHVDDLTEMIDHFVSAIDDATSNLEIALDRGGVDLGKVRKEMEKQVVAFLERLERINAAKDKRLEEFQFTWDDSREAAREFLEVAKNIPEGMIPPKQPTPVRAEEEEGKPQPGAPTLRKKDEAPKPPPSGPAPPRPPEPPKPQPPPPIGSHGAA